MTEWLGNTPRVADKHYLQTTDAHDEPAATTTHDGSGGGATGGAVSVGQRLNRTDSYTTSTLQNTKKAVILGESTTASAPPVGLEPTT
ncbi:hypothetical protein [Adhaeretor mobilis]|uniref:hypothetical protein n=1 Tax=Adhaeretor mobilis TaxID=1930276 RepID=UPI001C54E455|nr:hypothetical protein [Adhaeretor mobilis]